MAANVYAILYRAVRMGINRIFSKVCGLVILQEGVATEFTYKLTFKQFKAIFTGCL
jgi:hypothetical protein